MIPSPTPRARDRDTLRQVNVCTIIAKNYVAQARVLARSFAEQHPDGRFWTLIIDDFDGFIDPAQQPFEILTPSDVGCSEFGWMAARYSVLELSTAVKPWLLRHLLDLTAAPVTYLDPDIRVFGPLSRLEELAARHGVVLIPHNAEPLPADGKRPGQIDVMIAGVYNLGHLSLGPGPEVDRLLDWWSDRLRRDCRVDPVWGYFVDQRWFDLVPGFMRDFAILRDPEYNVAYWNLHAHTFERDGADYLVDGRPLAFFHFSGFDPEKPTELSLHQNRINLASHPALAHICTEYAEATRREGFMEARAWPYTYGALNGGIPFDRTLRKLFVIAEERGEIVQRPFTPEGDREFLGWLSAQQPDAPPGISRLLAYVYGTRPDLRSAYPDVEGRDLPRLLEWAQVHGKGEVEALGYLPLPDGASSSGARRPGWRGYGGRLRRGGLNRVLSRIRARDLAS
jgi:hypothetical protein